MPKMNWSRYIIGSLVASILAFFSDGFLHERIVKADWEAVFAKLCAPPGEHTSVSLLYFAIFELGRGFVSVLLYVLMRERCGRGPKTAVCAGVIAWVAFSVTTPAQYIPLGFYSNALWIKVGLFQLVTSIVIAIVGAAIYKDQASA